MDESFTDPQVTAEPVQADNPTEAPSAPVEQGTSATVDHFDEKFDPNSLPPELQPAYKQMQAGLTKKFQSHAEERQAFEAEQQALNQHRQLLDRIQQDPHLQQQLDAYWAEADNPEPDEFVDPFEQKLNEIEQRQQAIEQRENDQRMQALNEQALSSDLDQITKLNGGQPLSNEELEVLGQFVQPGEDGVLRVLPAYERMSKLFEIKRQQWIAGKTQAPSAPPSAQQGSEKFDITDRDSRIKHLAAHFQGD